MDSPERAAAGSTDHQEMCGGADVWQVTGLEHPGVLTQCQEGKTSAVVLEKHLETVLKQNPDKLEAHVLQKKDLSRFSIFPEVGVPADLHQDQTTRRKALLSKRNMEVHKTASDQTCRLQEQRQTRPETSRNTSDPLKHGGGGVMVWLTVDTSLCSS